MPLTYQAATVYATTTAGGAPRGPDLGEALVYHTEIEDRVLGLETGYDVSYETRAELYADLAWVAGKIGRVFGDSTPAYIGIYKKSGGSGAGSWAKIGDFPTDIADDAVTFAKMQDISSGNLLGRYTGSTGNVEQVVVGGGLEFSGSNLRLAAMTGDVTKTAGAGATVIADEAVTFAKMAHIATDTLLGRDSASTGDVEALTVGGGVEFTGSGGIQRSALTGDVTASAGSGTTVLGDGVVATAKLADNAVTLAKMQDLAEQRLLGAETAGSPIQVLVGTGLEIATGNLRIADDGVTFAKMQDIVTDVLLGRDSAGDGPVQQIGLTGGLEFTGLGGIQIADNGVTNAKAANMAEGTVKMRRRGAGSGDPTDTTLENLRADMGPDGDAKRPGDAPWSFITSIAGGEPAAIAPLTVADTASNSVGRVVTLSASRELIAMGDLTAMEAGREYRVRSSVRRTVNTPDPANDAVEIAIAWYDQNKIALTGGSASTVFATLTTLTTSSGVANSSRVVGLAAGGNVETIAPAGAVYFRPFIQHYGASPQTAVIVLDAVDVTDLALFDPDVAAFEARVAALETIDAGDRLDDLEAEVGEGEVRRYATITEAESKTIPAYVEHIEVLGDATIDDGERAIYERSVSSPVNGFTTVDGAHWEQVTTYLSGAKNLADLSDAEEARANLGLQYALTPQMFGALGDGSTDDSAAFELAKDAGGLVFIPKTASGYQFSSPVLSNDGIAAWLPDPSLTWAQLTDSGQFSLWRGKYTGGPTGANIWRFSDRAFFGYAASAWAGDSTTSTDAGNSWLNEAADGPSYLAVNAGVLFMNGPGDTVNLARNSNVGIVSAMKSSAAASGVIGIGVAIISDQAATTSWGFIAELQREAGTASLFGMEIAAKNKGNNGIATPVTLATYGPSGVYGIWAQGGGDPAFGGSPTNPSTAVIAVVGNSNTWNSGFVFGSNSLTDGEVLAMSSQGVGGAHQLKWYDNNGAVVFRVMSDATDGIRWDINRKDGGLTFNAESINILRLNRTASAVNFLDVYPAVSTVGPLIVAVGTDTNISGRIRGAGTGGWIFQDGAAAVKFQYNTTGIGFFGATPVARGALAAATGTVKRTTFDTATVTLPELAGYVMAMGIDGRAFGLYS